jgi:hypothetical protein
LRRIYSLFYRLLPVTKVNVDDELYLLNEDEIAAIKKREHIAIVTSAIIGALGVILLYVPYYAFPQWFQPMSITLIGKTFQVPLTFLLYSVLLVVIEIFLLTFLNIWCAHEIAVATGFLNYENKKHPEKHNLLLDIGLEKKNKKILTYGIDPLMGVNRKALIAWNLLFILKATLTNFLFRFLIQRVMGRYLIRAVQDFAGIPIFAFWNAYGTRTILKEARVIIMGQNLIEVLINRIKMAGGIPEEKKSIISDTMQYIAVSKRDFHQNHFLLTRNLFELFGIEERKGHWEEKKYIEELKAAEPTVRNQCLFIILLGDILDGKISSRERFKLKQLRELGLLDYNAQEMKQFTRDFLEGRGIEPLFQKYLG